MFDLIIANGEVVGRALIVGVYALAAAAAALGRRRKGAWGRAALAAPLFLMVLL
ncbi:MAG: hypothetical protein HY321_10500 [Armatimonadetes bacterium]|nr:hypothetical protein [Armatimonadota bacterium]